MISNDPLAPKPPPSSSDTLAYAQLRQEKEKLDTELASIRTDYEKSVKVNCLYSLRSQFASIVSGRFHGT